MPTWGSSTPVAATTPKNGSARKGSEGDIDALLTDGTTLAMTVFIVQPGVGHRRQDSQASWSATAYLITSEVSPLRVSGSASADAVEVDANDDA